MILAVHSRHVLGLKLAFLNRVQVFTSCIYSMDDACVVFSTTHHVCWQQNSPGAALQHEPAEENGLRPIGFRNVPS
jgi:hypothetical protein